MTRESSMSVSAGRVYRAARGASTGRNFPERPPFGVTLPIMWTLLLALGACAPPPYSPPAVDTGDETDDTGSADDTAMSISYVWPANEAPAVGCAMVVVDVKNLKLVDGTVFPDPVEGEGHYHLLYDNGFVACYTPYCLIGFGETGQFEITARLVQNNHDPYFSDPEGTQTIDASLLVNATAGECALGTPSAPY